MKSLTNPLLVPSVDNPSKINGLLNIISILLGSVFAVPHQYVHGNGERRFSIGQSMDDRDGKISEISVGPRIRRRSFLSH